MNETYSVNFRHITELARIGNASLLIDWLKSGDAIGQGERLLLADLIDELAARPAVKPRGRPEGGRHSFAARNAAVARFDAHLSASEVRKVALHAVATETGVSQTTLRGWIADVRAIERDMNGRGLPNWRLADWGNVPE